MDQREPDGQPTRIAAVICTRNRSDKVGNAIASVLANDHPDFVLTVVDQSTDDRTRDVVAQIAATDARLRYDHMDQSGLSRAYNRGVALSNSEILAFTDDDCLAPVDWLRSIEAAFDTEPDADLLYGQVVSVRAFPADEPLTPQLQFGVAERLSKADGFRVIGMGANFAARRRLFERTGPFDEVLGGGGPLKSAQDYDLAYRTFRSGGTILLRPEVVIEHDGRRESEDWPTLLANYGFGDGAFYTKHVRCLDPYAMWIYGRHTVLAVARQSVRAVRERRVELSYLAGLARGSRMSFAYEVDSRARLYVGAKADS